jgi:hypothetical protein
MRRRPLQVDKKGGEVAAACCDFTPIRKKGLLGGSSVFKKVASINLSQAIYLSIYLSI